MITWHNIAPSEQFTADVGSCALVDGQQIAIFNFGLSEWYAVQNQCPHEGVMCISRGLIGDRQGEPKVTCPLHKNAFSLGNGHHLGNHPEWQLRTYPVRIQDGEVWIGVEAVPD